MNIILFSQFYYPERIAAAFRATSNARLWSSIGHRVTVFTTFPNYPTGRIFEGYSPKLLSIEQDGQITVLRSKIKVVPNTSTLKRIINGSSFLIWGLVNILFQRKKIISDYDVVIGSSGIVFTGTLAWLFAKRQHIPFVFEIRDITFRQLIATGSAPESIKVKLMKRMELKLCKKAKAVVVVTNGFKDDLVAEGIEPEKIHVITNGAELYEEKMLHLETSKVAIGYFGTFGISQGIIEVIKTVEAAHKVISSLELLLVGEGAEKTKVDSYLAKKNYQFIRILPSMPLEQLESYYKQICLGIASLRNTPDFKNTIPSKIFQIMARGIPVLYIGCDGEAASILRTYNAGIVLTGSLEKNQESLQAFFQRDDWSQQLEEMGQNGQNAVNEHFDRSLLANHYAMVLENLALSKRKLIDN